jgi:hypothetical protein
LKSDANRCKLVVTRKSGTPAGFQFSPRRE